MPAASDLIAILERLTRARVEFIVVGGVAAVVQGAPITTNDLDLVYSTTSENLERLAGALVEMRARYRDPAGRRILPDVERLRSFRVSLLETDLGPLDLLREIGQGKRYEDLAPRSVRLGLAEMTIRVLCLEALIEAKEQAGRPKDLIALPFLREVLDRRRDQED